MLTYFSKIIIVLQQDIKTKNHFRLCSNKNNKHERNSYSLQNETDISCYWAAAKIKCNSVFAAIFFKELQFLFRVQTQQNNMQNYARTSMFKSMEHFFVVLFLLFMFTQVILCKSVNS